MMMTEQTNGERERQAREVLLSAEIAFKGPGRLYRTDEAQSAIVAAMLAFAAQQPPAADNRMMAEIRQLGKDGEIVGVKIYPNGNIAAFVPACRDATAPLSPAVEGLADALSGHWSTSAGRDMAVAALDDPHMEHNRARQPDLQLANDVFLSPGIGNLTAAKERIRWLSARLAVALNTRTAQPIALDRSAMARTIEIAIVEKTMHHPAKKYWQQLKWLWPHVADAVLALHPSRASVVEALRGAVSAIDGMVRLADMGFADSLKEPEENGNFAAYEQAKRAADAGRAALASKYNGEAV
jgi:hypothetical protein